jgi:multidrug resistance protein, MATE family
VSSHPQRPAQRIDAAGRAHVDYGAIWLLAGPLMANSAVQSVLNLTDTWFVSRLSTTATAAMSAIYWVVLCAIILLGGVGMAVQTFAAQAHGAGRYARAAQTTWSGLYASLLSVPLFVAIGLLGAPLLAALHLDPQVQQLALAYWWPRLVAGGPLGLLVWSLTGFFNGIGRSRLTLVVTLVMALANVPFNQFFMFELGLGIAGSAWGTVAAEVAGLAVALAFFLGARTRRRYRSHLTWRRPAIRRQFAVGVPMGLGITADLLGLALFQLMLVSVSTVAGASTQIVMMLTSIAYLPGLGIGMAGTTFVGQAVGAHDPDWARRVGDAIIRLAAGFMGVIGIVLALASPWLLPLFVNAADPRAAEVVALGSRLIWLAACYQAFDGLNVGSNFCLRGAGDVRVPALIVAVLSWLVWVPLAHSATFARGAGWVDFLPQFGYGAIGGWAASVAYVVVLGSSLWWRWRSGAWRRIRL